MKTDVQGIEIENALENLLIAHKQEEAKTLVTKTWEEQQVATCGLWSLLFEGKGDQALHFRKTHVLARDTTVSLYLCSKFCPDKIQDFLKFPILNVEKQRLLDNSLLFSIKAEDREFCQTLINLGADINQKQNQPLKLACLCKDNEFLEVLRLNGLNLETQDNYAFKHAFDQEVIDRLDYIYSHIKCIPITIKEMLSFLEKGRLISVKWMSGIQNSLSSYCVDSGKKSYFQFCDMDPEEDYINDTNLLLINYIRNQRVKFPLKYRTLTKRILKVLPTYAIQSCEKSTDKEIAEISKEVLIERKSLKAVKSSLDKGVNLDTLLL
jgi:hypothetical protein